MILLYINDLPSCPNEPRPRMFADDTNITASGKCMNDIESAVNLDLAKVAYGKQTEFKRSEN